MQATPSYSAYRGQQQRPYAYYSTRAPSTAPAHQQYNNYNNNNNNTGYQTLSPSTFYPTSPTTVYSSRVTATPTPGLSTYSGYVFGTQKPAHTRLVKKRVRFQRPRPPPSSDPASLALPPGRAPTASTGRSRRRPQPQYVSYAPSAASQQQQQQPYPFHMPAYGPPQPYANTNANAHAHRLATAPSAVRIPATRTSRLARRPSQANLGYGRLGGRSRTSAKTSHRRTNVSLCAMVGRLADVWAGLLGNGPNTAARRAANAAAKLSGAASGSRGRKRDAAWRAQLEDVICRECARLLEYAQSPVYTTQLHALDALNTLANEYHVVLRCLARIGARPTLDSISELIRARKAKLGASPGPGQGYGQRRSSHGHGHHGRYTREQLHELRVRCSTLKQRLRYRNRERKSE